MRNQRSTSVLVTLGCALSLPVPLMPSVEVAPTTENVDRSVEIEAWKRAEWRGMHEALATLWTGTREQKLEVALDAARLFYLLDVPPESGNESADDIIDSLRALLGAIEDEWLLDRLFLELADAAFDELSPLFREALTHESPAVRWRAVLHFTASEDPQAVPELLRLWRKETRPWVRVDLMDALTYNDAEGFAEECIDLIGADDVDLALAAIETVGEEAPPRALARLIERSMRGPTELREAAITALGRFGHSLDAQDALIEASKAGDRASLTAIQVLGELEADAARLLLEKIAFDTAAGPCVRGAAVFALDRPDDPALDVMLADAMEPSCNSLEVTLPENLMRIDAPGEPASVRCWKGPHWTGDPRVYPRIAEGMPAEIYDRFENGDEHWVELMDRDCWVPLDTLTPADEWVRPAQPTTYGVELDVEVREIETAHAERWMDTGLLRVFDLHERVTGIAIDVDPTRPEEVELFVETYEPGEGLLHRATTALLHLLASDDSLPPELADRLHEFLPRQVPAVHRDSEP